MNVLIVAMEEDRWGTYRLPKALAAAGFQVAALCRETCPLLKTRFIHRQFRLNNARGLGRIRAQLIEAMDIWKPRLVIPGDERAAAMLHAIIKEAWYEGIWSLSSAQLATLIFSLGAPEQLDAMLLKSHTQELARSLGVRVPQGETLSELEDASQVAATLRYPVVLKQSLGWGGAGVRVCRDRHELAAGIAQMRGERPSMLKSRIRQGLDRNWFHTDSSVDLQRAIAGRPAMYCVAALGGKVVAGFAGFPEQTNGVNGHSTIVRLGAHEAMAQASRAMVQAYRGSGILGFDFMIEDTTGDAYLLECNPRPIQVCHLGPRIGVDLCGALFAELAGKSVAHSATAAGTAGETIALFPQEWQRAPDSAHIGTVFHDVPWDDPQLLQVMVSSARFSTAPALPFAAPAPEDIRPVATPGAPTLLLRATAAKPE